MICVIVVVVLSTMIVRVLRSECLMRERMRHHLRNVCVFFCPSMHARLCSGTLIVGHRHQRTFAFTHRRWRCRRHTIRDFFIGKRFSAIVDIRCICSIRREVGWFSIFLALGVAPHISGCGCFFCLMSLLLLVMAMCKTIHKSGWDVEECSVGKKLELGVVLRMIKKTAIRHADFPGNIIDLGIQLRRPMGKSNTTPDITRNRITSSYVMPRGDAQFPLNAVTNVLSDHNARHKFISIRFIQETLTCTRRAQ